MLDDPRRSGRDKDQAPSDGFLERWFRISRLSYPVPPHARTLPYILGGITFIGFLLLFSSGLLMGQFYQPTPDRAYETVKHLINEVPGGRLLRSFHYWMAQAVILSLILHLLRIFISGAYKPPRIFTWYFGVSLLGIALFGSYFSGTVLKWDQESFDALQHYSEGLRFFGPIGKFMGSTEAIPLNIKIYLSHVSFFPLLLLVLIAGHFYLINTFSLSPLPFGKDSTLASLPEERMTGRFLEHANSIFLYSILYYGLVAIIALIFPAPLGPPVSGEETGVKPPWPFLWFYGLENLTGKIDTIVYASGLLFLLLILLPILDRGEERNPLKRKGTMTGGAMVLLFLIGLSLYAAISTPQVHHHGGEAAPHHESSPDSGHHMDGEGKDKEDEH
ncbi:MAG: cytochrome bc complex cytochrome b subunit [Nitrospirae bacterium]|nr:cytochrome bc complex cytochrome b subunit [Nitrospirota bacterium]